MSRPKVPDDKRKRIAQACEFCKARKQKCNGQTPCSLCIRKGKQASCTYDPAHRRASGAGSSKRPQTETSSPSTPATLMTPTNSASPPGCEDTLMAGSPATGGATGRGAAVTSAVAAAEAPFPPASATTLGAGAPGFATAANTSALSVPTPPQFNSFLGSAAATPSSSEHSVSVPSTPAGAPTPGTPGESGPYEPHAGREPPHKTKRLPQQDDGRVRDIRIPSVIYSQERMLGLALPEGRTTNLLGRSSHLAYLDALRNYLEVKGMHNPLLRPLDNRFELKELAPSFETANGLPPASLPGPRETYVLVESFLINTHGLVHVFEEMDSLDKTINKIMETASYDHQAHILLTLAIAIGWVMAAPGSEAREIEIDPEAYFQGVKNRSGEWPADLATIQAHVLMTVYALAVVRRNTAFLCIGQACLWAQMLGMHKEEELLMRTEEIILRSRPWVSERKGSMRRNTWRSVVILDRFVTAQLGRPSLIHDEHVFPMPPDGTGTDHTNMHDAVRGTEVLSTIIRETCWKAEASGRLAADIAQRDEQWPYMMAGDGDAEDDRRQQQADGSAESRRAAVHRLHNRLLQLHSVILLGRPFVLYDVYAGWMNSPEPQDDMGAAMDSAAKELSPLPAEFEFLPRDCIRASYRSIALVKQALEQGYLPQRNPFVIYFLISAALVVLSQDVSSPTFKSSSDNILRGDDRVVVMKDALEVFRYCAQTDAQAAHLLTILEYLFTQCKSSLKMLAQTVDRRAPTISQIVELENYAMSAPPPPPPASSDIPGFRPYMAPGSESPRSSTTSSSSTLSASSTLRTNMHMPPPPAPPPTRSSLSSAAVLPGLQSFMLPPPPTSFRPRPGGSGSEGGDDCSGPGVGTEATATMMNYCAAPGSGTAMSWSLSSSSAASAPSPSSSVSSPMDYGKPYRAGPDYLLGATGSPPASAPSPPTHPPTSSSGTAAVAPPAFATADGGAKHGGHFPRQYEHQHLGSTKGPPPPPAADQASWYGGSPLKQVVSADGYRHTCPPAMEMQID